MSLLDKHQKLIKDHIATRTQFYVQKKALFCKKYKIHAFCLFTGCFTAAALLNSSFFVIPGIAFYFFCLYSFFASKDILTKNGLNDHKKKLMVQLEPYPELVHLLLPAIDDIKNNRLQYSWYKGVLSLIEKIKEERDKAQGLPVGFDDFFANCAHIRVAKSPEVEKELVKVTPRKETVWTI